MTNLINQLENKVMSGKLLSWEETLPLSAVNDLESLFNAADRLRVHFRGNQVDLCTIMNVKSGKCSENCKYCAQSGHYATGITTYPLVAADQIVQQAKQNEAAGVHRFSLVTSGRGITGTDFETILRTIETLKSQTRLKICASFGIISYHQAVRLIDAGLDRYHHNVETSSDFFSQICDTHSWEERIETITAVSAAGLEVCAGGIIGMGESMEQRIRMALEIRELDVKSVPVNVLNPIPGTPLEAMKLLQPLEILKTMAIFRFILPDAWIRYAGGRSALGELQGKGFRSGVNAALVGNYLTTVGNRIDEDLQLIRDQGLEV